VFATASHFHPSLIFPGKMELTRVEPIMGVHSNGRLLALPANMVERQNTDLTEGQPDTGSTGHKVNPT
jgi:hypothetical protein